MASAAAVGADAARSPPHNDDLDAPGVVSAIGSREDGIQEKNDVEEDMDEEIRGTSRRKGPVEAAAVGDQEDQQPMDEDGDEDLFGDEEDEVADKAPRQLDDEELDSGDDLDRNDRVGEEEEVQDEQQVAAVEKVTMDLEMSRQPVPEPSDGELYLLKMPDFMAIDPHAWVHSNFQPPTTDHHSDKAPSAAFSAFNVATSTIRWRHSPSDPSKLQSNARILRWSDGSLTLQLGSQPPVQYEIEGNPLAPPQRNPLKPTPVSQTTTSTSKGGRQGDGTVPGERYDFSKDAFTYLVAPMSSTETLRVTHKVTAGLSMRRPNDAQDDAIEILQAALAKAANASKVNGVGNGPADLELIEEDPEKKRQEAEKAMRQKAALQKRAQAAQERNAEREGRVTGRLGGGGSRGGLNASMLEDEDGMGTTRGRRTGATPKKSRRRRNSIYSDDEDFGRKRFATREDEYDEEDGFLVGSDEEEEVEEEEEQDPDDGIVEVPRERRERTPKRERERGDVGGVGGEEDAEGEEDEEVQATRVKRRRIVDEDDDEEE